MTNPLSSLAHRTARWCALHPWRAILGWVAFVALAVGLAAMVPTQETTDADGRLGDSGRAAAMVDAADFDDADTEQVLITSASGDLDQAEAQQAAAAVVAGMTALEAVDAGRRAAGQPGRDGLPRLRAAGPRPGRRRRLQDVTAAVQADFPAARRPPVRRRQPRRRHRRPGRRRPRLGRDAQPADHAGPDAARLRRADRGRAAGAAGRHQRRRDDRHPRAGLPPGPRGLDGHQHDRADRHGGGRRLLALLPQARARGAGQGALRPGRGRDRGPDLRPLDPRVRRRGDLLDGRPVPDRRLDVQLAGHRLDRGGRGRRARLDHGAARAARQARPLGRPPPGAAAPPVHPPDGHRLAISRASGSWARSPATRSSRSGCRPSWWSCSRCRRSA